MTTQFKFHTWWLLVAVTLGLMLALVPGRAGAAIPDDLDSFVVSLEGGWAGQDNLTPFGQMGFAMLFEREADGSLHSRSSLNSETYIDIRFEQDQQGRWVLHEEARMEGLGVQAYSLVPAGAHDGVHRWIYEPDPEFLSMEVGMDGTAMLMNVRLRGRDHVKFRLDRLPEEAWPELKRQMELAASQSPEEGISIRQAVENPPPAGLHADPVESAHSDVTDGKATDEANDPIDRARQALSENPEDARAHLTLAQTLGNAINQNPANGPLYAFEMLSALQRTIELDPEIGEAYHWLVSYYLNAPPIAGGSLDKAEETS